MSSHTIWLKHNWRLISETNPTYTLILFWKKFLPTWLIEPTLLFNFGNFSYLHVIGNCTLESTLKSLGLVISFIYFLMIKPNRKSSETKPPLMAFNIKPAYYVVCIVCNNLVQCNSIQYNAFWFDLLEMNWFYANRDKCGFVTWVFSLNKKCKVKIFTGYNKIHSRM